MTAMWGRGGEGGGIEEKGLMDKDNSVVVAGSSIKGGNGNGKKYTIIFLSNNKLKLN